MCFSATASFVAAGALGAAGGMTLSKTKARREIPLASVPLLFGIQQAVEGIVWISFNSPLINTTAALVYSLFSHVLWPIFIPFALLLIETREDRKRILRAFLVAGSIVGLYLLYFMLTNPVTAQVVNCSIAYFPTAPNSLIATAFYVVVICGSCFVSSHKILNLLGIAILISFAIATWFYTQTFVSVWCFFAAILSGILYWYFTTNPRRR